MSDSIIDWETLFHKNVRSKDREDAGNVDALQGDNVIITSQGDLEGIQFAKRPS